jgi:hypothetical protein
VRSSIFSFPPTAEFTSLETNFTSKVLLKKAFFVVRRLSSVGHEQTVDLHSRVNETLAHAELVVISPLSRAIQTFMAGFKTMKVRSEYFSSNLQRRKMLTTFACGIFSFGVAEYSYPCSSIMSREGRKRLRHR